MHQIVVNPFCSPTCWLSLPKSALKGGKNVNPGYFCKNQKKIIYFCSYELHLMGRRLLDLKRNHFLSLQWPLKIVKI